MNLLNVAGKIAVVTGGAGGIGAATVTLLRNSGAVAEIFDIENPDGAPVDVTNEAAVREALARVARAHGGIDILVNSAGRVARRPAVELDLAEWQAVVDLNLTATFICSRLAHPYLKTRSNASIVNVASIMGLSGGLFPNASYQAAKGGVVNLTRALALEWAADDIRVNAVAPTFVRTKMTEQVFSNPDVLKTVMANSPLARLPEPDEIAAAIVYLCSPAARCITGIVFPVDSGYLAR